MSAARSRGVRLAVGRTAGITRHRFDGGDSAGRSADPSVRTWRRHCVLAVGVLASILMLAVVNTGSAHAAGAPQIASSLNDVLNNIRNWVLGILASVTIAFWSWGGLKFLLASGDPGEIEKAKNAFKNGAYGFALALLAPLIVAALESILG